MLQYLFESCAFLINAHQAGANMFLPDGIRPYLEAWAESKVGK